LTPYRCRRRVTSAPDRPPSTARAEARNIFCTDKEAAEKIPPTRPAGCDAVTVFIRSPAPETVRQSRMTGCFADVARRAPLSTSMAQVNVGFRSLLGHDPQGEEPLSCLRPAKGNAVLRGGPRHGAATGEPALFAVISVALAGRREPGPAVRDHLPGAGGAVIVPLRQRPTRRC